MKTPRICAVIVDTDLDAVKRVEPLVDLFEARFDLIGGDWPEIVKQLKKPWIACNRSAREGGSWQGEELPRINELLKALELGAAIVDIELGATNLEDTVSRIRKQARCLLSFHDLKGTPSLDTLQATVKRQLEAGADLCKVVTTARSFTDNLTVLKLISDFRETNLVSFAMTPMGLTSRILCPLVGGHFTYASIKEGGESAPGQITVSDLRNIYRVMGYVK